MALISGTPGRSEMSHGRGRVTHPDSDFQSHRKLAFPQIEDSEDIHRNYMASMRIDETVPDDVIIPDMLYLNGNPDTFGPNPPLVQEKAHRPPALNPLPRYRTGVYRES